MKRGFGDSLTHKARKRREEMEETKEGEGGGNSPRVE